jgi:hypothetical protein
VHIALAQDEKLMIAELIEHEERVVTLAAKVVVPCCAFMITMGWADGTVHIKRDPFGWPRIVLRINLMAGRVS